jgi:hypothetical protein
MQYTCNRFQGIDTPKRSPHQDAETGVQERLGVFALWVLQTEEV